MRIAMTAVGAMAVSQSPLAAQLVRPVNDKLPGGIPRVMSAGPTMWRDTSGWHLVLERTIQPPDGSPGELGRPSDMALLADGRVLVVDEAPMRIRLYDARGTLGRTIGREGSGPGEYRSPGISVTQDRLLIQDPSLSRATIYSLDGNLIRSFQSTCCNFGPKPFLDDRGHITTAAFGSTKGKPREQWIVFDTLGTRLDSLDFPAAMVPKAWTVVITGPGGATGSSSYTIPFAAANRNVRLRDGTMLHGRTDRYEFLVTRTGRDTVRVFGRTDAKAVPIPDAYRDSVYHARVDRNERLHSVAKESDVPRTFAVWDDLNVDGAGNFWVSAGGGHSGASRFDVFAPGGAYLGSVASPWRTGERTSWAGDRVAVLDVDANDLPRIRVFRIQRSGGH